MLAVLLKPTVSGGGGQDSLQAHSTVHARPFPVGHRGLPL